MIEHRIETTRRARYFVLGELASAEEVWIVVHGYGQLASEFLQPFRAVVTPQRAVVAPEALNRYYKDGGAAGPHTTTPIGTTWMTREDRDAEILDYVDFLDAVARQTRYNRQRLAVLGFSQGVATVTRWVSRGQTQVDRCILWAGSLPADVDLQALRSRCAAALELVQGDRDEFAKWADQQSVDDRLVEAGVPFQRLTFAGGHRLDRLTLQALGAR